MNKKILFFVTAGEFTNMPPKSSAEKIRLFWAKMSKEKQDEVREGNRQQQPKCSEKWDSNKWKTESRESRNSVTHLRKKRIPATCFTKSS